MRFLDNQCQINEVLDNQCQISEVLDSQCQISEVCNGAQMRGASVQRQPVFLYRAGTLITTAMPLQF